MSEREYNLHMGNLNTFLKALEEDIRKLPVKYRLILNPQLKDLITMRLSNTELEFRLRVIENMLRIFYRQLEASGVQKFRPAVSDSPIH